MEIKDKKEILFVLPIIGEPRFPKRMSMLSDCGFNVRAVAYDREYYETKKVKYPTKVIGRIENGRYLKRIKNLVISFPELRRQIRGAHVVYTFGPDMALISIIASFGLKKPILLEIADIREIQTNHGFYGVLYRSLDKIIVSRCSLLIVTAIRYSNEYYKKWLKSGIKSVLMENKILESEYRRYHELKDNVEGIHKLKKESVIRIGYYGLLRCKKSLQVLDLLAKKGTGKYEIIIAGYPLGVNSELEQIKENKNVKYLGVYKSPDDLADLYSSVDLIWACYPFPGIKDYNWRWARTNRFYESCYYKKPIIALSESGDASDVEKYDIGIIVENDEVYKIVDRLLSISGQDIVRWSSNIEKVPHEVYIYSNEAERLSYAINELLRMP